MNPLLYPILSVIAAVGIYFSYISPTLVEIDVLEKQDTQFVESLKDANEVETKIINLESLYKNITKEDLMSLERFLPRTIDRTLVVRDLSIIAEQAEVRVIDVKVSEDREEVVSEKDKNLKGQLFSLAFEGTYEDFKTVLVGLEKNLQMGTVERVKVKEPQQTSRGVAKLPMYEITLMFYSYNIIDVESE